MIAAIVAEDFAGMRSQGIGLVEKAGLDWRFCPITIRSPWSLLSARFWPLPLACIEPVALPAQTRLIVSIGGTGGVVGTALGRRHRLPVVQIQNPRHRLGRFDVVIANAHDGVTGRNVLVSRNALHPLTQQTLDDARTRWHDRLRTDDRPFLAVLVGGGNGRFSLGTQEAVHIADSLLAFTAHHGMQAVLTPSRRTDAAAICVLKARLEPAGIRVYTGEGDENPYVGLLACADMIAVTTDSVSMISEAVSTRAPVLILPLPGHSTRIGHFVQALQTLDRVRPFAVEQGPWAVCPLDDTPEMAREMRLRLTL